MAATLARNSLAYPTAQDRGAYQQTPTRVPPPEAAAEPTPTHQTRPLPTAGVVMVPGAAALVPPSPAAASLARTLAGDEALKHSLARIRELMGEANVTLPDNLFKEVIGFTAAAH